MDCISLLQLNLFSPLAASSASQETLGAFRESFAIIAVRSVRLERLPVVGAGKGFADIHAVSMRSRSKSS